MPQNTLVAAAEQPYGVTIHTADGVVIKQMIVPKAGTVIPQHSHVYDHTTMVAAGSLLVQSEGIAHPGEIVEATGSVLIPAGVKHLLTSLQDNTVAYCIHNATRSGEIEVAEEHCIVGCHAAPEAV